MQHCANVLKLLQLLQLLYARNRCWQCRQSENFDLARQCARFSEMGSLAAATFARVKGGAGHAHCFTRAASRVTCTSRTLHHVRTSCALLSLSCRRRAASCSNHASSSNARACWCASSASGPARPPSASKIGETELWLCCGTSSASPIASLQLVLGKDGTAVSAAVGVPTVINRGQVYYTEEVPNSHTVS